MKTTANKIIDIWIQYSNHLIFHGNDEKALSMRTNAMSKTIQLVQSLEKKKK